MSSHLANGASFPSLDFVLLKTFKILSDFTFNALPPFELVDLGFCLYSSRIFRARKNLKRRLYMYLKFTYCARRALVHAFSHAIRVKSLSFLTLLSQLVFPFLPPSFCVDNQFPSLTVELSFFHSGDRDRGLVFRSTSSQKYLELDW